MTTKKAMQKAKHSNQLQTNGSRNELIQIQHINGEQLIDARELHKFIGSRQQFSNWIKNRVQDYGFKQNLDYYTLNKIIKGGKATDYQISLDMAKELAMIERNEKGRQIRQYFIACEKKLRSQIEILPNVQGALKGIKSIRMNGLKLYPLKEVRSALGLFSPINQAHSKKYQQHFVVLGGRKYCTEDYANHAAHQRVVTINRKVLQTQQGILPLNFGDTNLLNA